MRRPHPIPPLLSPRLGFCLVAVWLSGCGANPFKKTPPPPPLSLEPPPGVAAPAHTLPQAVTAASPPSYVDVDSSQLEAALVRSQQESQLMQDEIAALQDQLASTSSQLAQTRAAGMPPPSATAGGAPAAVASTPAATMQSAVAELRLTGDLKPRFDGAVVRIDMPADELFDAGTANLLPGGVAVLTQVAEELERVFPGHFVGIEGHLDTEPLQSQTWTSPHQLTAARAAAVFDFFTTRTTLQEGQLFIVAHGANHPLVSNATAAGRARNRRVELVVYPERTGSDG